MVWTEFISLNIFGEAPRVNHAKAQCVRGKRWCFGSLNRSLSVLVAYLFQSAVSVDKNLSHWNQNFLQAPAHSFACKDDDQLELNFMQIRVDAEFTCIALGY
jgi:hypothetical protein